MKKYDKKMKRNLSIAVCCVILTVILAGCQLAQETTDQNEDRPVGIFITTDYLDLTQDKIYAEQVTKVLTDTETGEKSEIDDFLFSGLAGMAFFSPTIITDEEHGTYLTSSSADEAISNRHMSINVGDLDNSTTLEGTIFVALSNTDYTFYFNPVYQEADGGVFVVPGDAMSMSGMSSGAAMSKTLNVTRTATEGNVTKTDSFTVSISIEIIHPPVKYVLLEMSADNAVISRNEYVPGELPDIIQPEASTAYIIIETHSLDEVGTINISREVYNRGDEYLETLFTRADGIVVVLSTQLTW